MKPTVFVRSSTICTRIGAASDHLGLKTSDMPRIKKLFDHWTRWVENELSDNFANENSIIIVPKTMNKYLSQFERSQILVKVEEFSQTLFPSANLELNVHIRKPHILPVELLRRAFLDSKQKRKLSKILKPFILQQAKHLMLR